jgi:broad specificity phosphatase PhoE
VQILLVRHAQPNIEHNPHGPADPGLSELGREQAARLNAWLAPEPIDLVVTSPKRRAIETVGGIIDAPVPHKVHEAFDEVDRLSRTYFPTELLASHGGEYWEKIRQQAWDEIGWDPPDVFRSRVLDGWNELVAARPAGRVLLGCHGGVVRQIVAHVLGVTGHPRIHISYSSITRVEIDDKGTAHLLSMNETAHIDGTRASATGALGHRPV